MLDIRLQESEEMCLTKNDSTVQPTQPFQNFFDFFPTLLDFLRCRVGPKFLETAKEIFIAGKFIERMHGIHGLQSQ